MALDRAAVAHIAALARIRLSEAELDPLADELSHILTWMEQLNEVDTSGVAPMASVDAADQGLARGKGLPLDGIPLAVKDLYCTKGVLITAASHILDGFRPTYESTVTDKLWQSGAVMLGKANLDEFAMGSSNTTSWYGPVENPWRRRPERQLGDNRPLVPGGSSGGSAAAVGARAALAATGTDTGGSIRH